ncbi:hypothetical protein CXB51_029355 [Gossypium anomalum]|uniref:Leucine-rich repeat-containing N-terminal plant-type domain-containing protein n=1 Tax=Gossypium anomalum TaxID=47600 RepID=A0A8J6CP61_9ROSI|nr:hypothetical protein CXB51_029355 [Gossypium anomalum]
MAIATMTTPLPISLFPFLLLIPAFCFTICHANSNVLCIQSEREALLKFKNHIIDPSNRLSSWVEGGYCCEWIGVFCHNSTGHVNQLYLAPLSEPDDFAPYAEWEAYYNSLLVGKINPSPLELKHLSSLDLSNNNFSSIQIPKFFSLLESLTYLNLSRARFQGAIPHNLGNLSRLQFLILEYLDLSSANLSKANDWVQVTFKLPSLLELHLKSCCVEDDPTSISVNSSKSLLALDLFWNRLTSVPKSIFCLHGLVSIDLSAQFQMDLSYNKIEDGISEILQSLSRCCLDCLESLNMSNNQFSGHLTDQLGQFKNLSYLSLAQNKIFENQLNVTFPLCFGQLESSETLDFRYNLLEGAIPPFQCRIIELGHCHLGPVFPPWLKFQKKLHHLDISYAGISDFLSNNSLSGSLSELICNPSLKGMVALYIYTNLLIGEIPDCWNRENHFNGTVPAWIGYKLSNLVVLSLRSSNFDALLVLKGREDNYGRTLGLFTSLDLSVNNLTREIPKEIGTLNLLTGNILDNISNIELMESLDLSMNRLNGEIPPSFFNLNFLNHFNVSYNNLTGQILASTQLQSFDNLSYVGNHLCRPPLTTNCTSKGVPTDVANNGIRRFVMGFWGVVAPLFLIRSWRTAFY